MKLKNFVSYDIFLANYFEHSKEMNYLLEGNYMTANYCSLIIGWCIGNKYGSVIITRLLVTELENFNSCPHIPVMRNAASFKREDDAAAYFSINLKLRTHVGHTT